MPLFNERDALSYGEVRVGPDGYGACYASALVTIHATTPEEALSAMLVAMQAARDAVTLPDCPFAECTEIREHHHPAGKSFPAIPAESTERGTFHGKGRVVQASVFLGGSPKKSAEHDQGLNDLIKALRPMS